MSTETDRQLAADQRAAKRAASRRKRGLATGVLASDLLNDLLISHVPSGPDAQVADEPDPDPIEPWYLQGLKPEQRAAVIGIGNLLQSGEPFTALLCGPAGTGKSHTLGALLRHVVENLGIDHEAIGLAAPTHKAVAVLAAAVGEPDDPSEARVTTVTKLLGLKRQWCSATETKRFLPGGLILPRTDLRLLVVDEASMLNSDHIAWLKETAATCGLLFVGDAAQLPPVEEGNAGGDHGPVFNTDAVEYTFTLAEVVRHQGPILQLATEIRTLQRGIPQPMGAAVEALDGNAEHRLATRAPSSLIRSDGGSVVALHDGTTFNTLLKEYFCSDEALSDTDFVRVLAFTNAHVADLNTAIRKWRYGTNCPAFVEGEIIVAADAISEPWNDERLLISNNSELCVVGFREVDAQNPHVPVGPDDAGEVWPAWQLDVELIGNANAAIGDSFRIQVLKPEAFGRFNTLQSETRRKANAASGRERKRLLNLIYQRQAGFAKVAPTPALTIHKSQGSTFRNVFLWPDLHIARDPRMQNQLGYVAATRASHELHLRRG